MNASSLVIDASAAVHLVLQTSTAEWVDAQLRGMEVFAPGHMKAEAFSALGRQFRAGAPASRIEQAVGRLRGLSVQVHSIEELLVPAWHRRENFRLVDALYVELAAQLDTVVITTDYRLARATPLAVAPPD